MLRFWSTMTLAAELASASARSMSAGLLPASRLNRVSPAAAMAQVRRDDLPTSKARKATSLLGFSLTARPLLELADRRPRERQPHYGAVGGRHVSIGHLPRRPVPGGNTPGPLREAGRKGRPGRSASDPSRSAPVIYSKAWGTQREPAGRSTQTVMDGTSCDRIDGAFDADNVGGSNGADADEIYDKRHGRGPTGLPCTCSARYLRKLPSHACGWIPIHVVTKSRCKLAWFLPIAHTFIRLFMRKCQRGERGCHAL